LNILCDDPLQEEWFRPQNVRSAHFHRGEFRASELLQDMITSSYQDPTFDEAHRELWKVTQAALIEWLSRGGEFTMPPLQRRGGSHRWVRDRVVFGLIGIAIGIIMGWLLAT